MGEVTKGERELSRERERDEEAREESNIERKETRK